MWRVNSPIAPACRFTEARAATWSWVMSSAAACEATISTPR